MKDYVLRIYRREKNDPRGLVGVVEEVGVKGNKTFSSLDELWSILNPSKAETVKTNELNRPNKLNKLNKPNKPHQLNKLKEPKEPKEPLNHRKQEEL